MIDENKLIKILLSESVDTGNSYGKGIASAISTVIRIINEQPKINEWIPCNKDNLPDDEVLCQDKRGEMMLGYVFEDEESESGFSAESENEYMYNCVAWMPKPQEYREDDTNG